MQLHSQTFFPLGHPVTVVSECAEVMEAAREEWGCWQELFEGPKVTLRVEVGASVEDGAGPVRFTGRPDGFTYFQDEDNAAEGEFANRSVRIRVTGSTVSDAAFLRYYFLEAAAYQMISALYFAPIHAACVSRPDGGGVLLCGDSGEGKSSLAYACARRGWIYTSDDASHLVRNGPGQPRAVGNANRLRLRPEAAELFGEFDQFETTRRGNGDVRYQLWTRLLDIRTSQSASVNRLVRLRRDGDSLPRFSDWPREEAEPWFESVFYHWAPKIAEEQRKALAFLLDNARLETLHYSRLDDAVAALGG